VNIATTSPASAIQVAHHRTAPRRTRAIAHRGASHIAPENTLLAYRLAVEFGVDAVEVDARLTRDGRIVLLHDADLARTTNLTGSVERLTHDDLRRCDAGYWFCPEGLPDHPFRGLGLTVPALAELFVMLARVRPTVEVLIEVKRSPRDPAIDSSKRLVERLVAELHGLDAIARCRVSSFDARSIDDVRQLAPDIRTALLVAPGADVHATIDYALTNGHSAVQVHDSAIAAGVAGRHLIEAVHHAGLEIDVWTVNARARMAELHELGVDGIISDDPERLCAVLDAARSVNA
jgi:glycerophosphoryl diester phosphodiesterase